MRDLHPQARRRVNEEADVAAEAFDSSLLSGRVHTAVSEDDQLNHVVDVTERAYALEDCTDLDESVHWGAFRAADELDSQIEVVREAAIATECFSLLKDARDGWFDESGFHTDDDVADAVEEARSWLNDHGETADLDDGSELAVEVSHAP